EEITDEICISFGRIFDTQTVRLKLREYAAEGILLQKKHGKVLRYSLSEDSPDTFCSDTDGFIDAVTFFSEAAPFGVIGSFLLDNLNIRNETFLYKHHFIVHTLEDLILLSLLTAIDGKFLIEIFNYGKSKQETRIQGIPLKVYISTQTGRRYIIMYLPRIKRFNSFRLDYIKSVKLLNEYESYDYYKEKQMK
ncbi:MAG TPA: WYL domain-containing protein, partial [Mobilitalea sp.]|nr:WYL domain-containing protein [Mobilitalea sp.]